VGNELSLLEFSVGFFSPSREIPGDYLKLGLDHFHISYNSLTTSVFLSNLYINSVPDVSNCAQFAICHCTFPIK